LRGIDLLGALIGFLGLLRIATLVIGEAEPGPCQRALVIDVERRVKILDRLVIFAKRDKALAARLIGRRDEGIAIDGVVEVADRPRVVAALLINQAAGVESLRVLGIQSNGGVEIVQRLIVAAALLGSRLIACEKSFTASEKFPARA
jgi:hypothetical protein